MLTSPDLLVVVATQKVFISLFFGVNFIFFEIAELLWYSYQLSDEKHNWKRIVPYSY